MAIVNSLQRFRSTDSSLDILWVGTVEGMETDIVTGSGIDIEFIESSGLVGKGLIGMIKGLYRLLVGLIQSYILISRFSPDVIFVTGGYTTVPVSVAGWLRQVPIAIYLPDVEPGLAIRIISKIADRVLITVEASQEYLKHVKLVVTGYPLRTQLTNALTMSQDESRSVLGIKNNKTILIVGGSLGARSINLAALEAGRTWVSEGFQIIHVTGKLGWIESEKIWTDLDSFTKLNYKLFPYLSDKIGVAMRASNIVVARAGASCLGEFPAFGLPAVLVPYPYSWSYQYANAHMLCDQGAAICVEDNDLPIVLRQTVSRLLNNDSEMIEFGKNARRFSNIDGADNIANELRSMVCGESL